MIGRGGQKKKLAYAIIFVGKFGPLRFLFPNNLTGSFFPAFVINPCYFSLLFQVRYTAFRDRPLAERQQKFIGSLREGHVEIVRKLLFFFKIMCLYDCRFFSRHLLLPASTLF